MEHFDTIWKQNGSIFFSVRLTFIIH